MINHTIYFSSHSIIPASPIPSFYYLSTSCSPHSIIPTPPILLIILSLLLLFFSFYYPCSSYSIHSIIRASPILVKIFLYSPCTSYSSYYLTIPILLNISLHLLFSLSFFPHSLHTFYLSLSLKTTLSAPCHG